MKKIALLLAFFAIGLQVLMAQTKEISGTVTSADDGGAIPGVSVSVKGTTLGTITDMDGAYRLKVPQDAKVLVFSFVGMSTQEAVIGTQSKIDVKLTSDNIAVDEVVVTALGITREKKSLGYAVQEVSGEEINSKKSDNFVTSLSGRVSGIQVKNNTNFGGSTNVIIRGSSSLTGNNQALFVVDGIPVDNSNTNNSGQLTGRSGYDYGNSAADINPNDIESISVLKGAAATALYGSRATNGVILVTTKKGKSTGVKAPQVRLSTNVTINSVDKSTFPKYQQEAGAGYGKYYYGDDPYPGFEHYGDVDGDGNIDYTVPYYEDASRGQAFDPTAMVFQWDALYPASPNYMKATPWVPGANGPASFFETGVGTSNNLEVSGGDDRTTYRFSYTYFDQNGIMPNSNLNKNNVVFNGTHKIFNNLKITSSANYVNTAGKGRPSTGYSDNIMSSFRQWSQTNVDYGLQKSLYHQTHQNITWNPVAYDDLAPAYWDNPYWVRYENYETDVRNRLIGYAQLDWDITPDLKAMGRYAIDTYNELQEERKAVGSGSGEFGVGRNDATSGYSRYSRAFTETNLDMMLNYHKKVTDKFDLTALLGTNIRRTKSESVYASTNNGLAVAGLYSLNNSVDPLLPPEENFYQVGVNGIFGSVSLGFDNTYFVDATLRRDQSSTLPAENNAYYYPSVTTSIIFSNLLKQDWLSLGKIRLNYAEVGSSAPALSVKDTYLANAPFSGTSLVTVPNTKQNSNLKPESQKALEAGLEMNFLKNRVGFDLAVYKNNTFDQLMPVSVSYATGFSSKWVNAGEIQNSGVELALTGTPVKTKDFKWDIRVNWASNKNKVVSLYTDESGNEVTNLLLGSLQGGVSINATVGSPYGTIKGSDFQYHDNGSKLIDPATGRYLKTSTNDKVIGDVNPDWTGGINNAFKYKNLTFSFLVDMQKGGDVFSLDLWYGMGTGLYAETAGLNDLGNLKRDAIVWNDKNNKTKEGGYAATSGGVIEDGVLADGSPNWVRRNNENYAAIGWSKDPNKRFVYDASYVKLREVTLTYDLPKSLVSKLSLANASVSFVGSNLWIISKNLPHADPEASQSSGNIQGWQSGVMPATRNYGFTLNLQF
ncbi:MAG: SusC/RagA family TonB-linked outer membrane protein [Prolixibacteraceae bacterium]